MGTEDLQGYAFVAAHDHVESVLPQELLRHVGPEVHTLPTGVGPTAYKQETVTVGLSSRSQNTRS
jgi:hypothetical protein